MKSEIFNVNFQEFCQITTSCVTVNRLQINYLKNKMIDGKKLIDIGGNTDCSITSRIQLKFDGFNTLLIGLLVKPSTLLIHNVTNY